ncbi:nuclease-related domain-containing protein [Streptomyces avermitilis]|uniref:nuclease-related domain-containing protein n=1 Tax=Streptomyces avermitilis TaxID=33903 RepID=UPI0033E4C21A
MADKVDIDHLLIGPGGVFSINTKHHHKKAVWGGDDAVKVDHGKPAPYARKSRAEDKRVVRVLERYCAFPVPVDPVLAFVGVTDLKVVATQLAVRVYGEREVAAQAPVRDLVIFPGSPAAMLQDPVHAASTDPDIRPLRAASGCRYAKTPASAFPLVTGSLGT